MDGNYEITDLNVTGAGKIMKMKVNGKEIDVVTDIKKNASDEITKIAINGVNQKIAGGGGESIPVEWHIWKTGADSYVLLPFEDATSIENLEDFQGLKIAILDDVAQIDIMDLTDYAGFDALSSFAADSADQFTVENDGVESVYKIGGATTLIVDLDTDINRTIDVSQYSGPVNLTPGEGKNAMIGARVTLTNIPAGGNGHIYVWTVGTNGHMYASFDVAPADQEAFDLEKVLGIENSTVSVRVLGDAHLTYTRVSDTEFTMSSGDTTTTVTRDSTNDMTIW